MAYNNLDGVGLQINLFATVIGANAALFGALVVLPRALPAHQRIGGLLRGNIYPGDPPLYPALSDHSFGRPSGTWAPRSPEFDPRTIRVRSLATWGVHWGVARVGLVNFIP